MKSKCKTVFKSILFFILITNLACKENSKLHKSDHTMQHKLYDFGVRYTEAWNSQKPEQVASFYAPDGILTVNNGTPVVGRDALIEFTKGFMEAFPDLKLTMDSLVSNNDRTEYHWTFVGTNTGPNGTGNAVDFSGFESWILNEDGLVKESIGTFDADAYDRQVSGQIKP